MIIKDKVCIVYDIESLKNVFTCTIYNTESKLSRTFEISPRRCDAKEMCKFFLDGYMFVGYNNQHYDDPIINYCIDYFSNCEDLEYSHIITESIKKMSDTIIKTDDRDSWKKWKYAHYFESIDLLTMLYSQALRVSLKEMQMTMEYDNVQEFITDWNSDLPVEQIPTLISYNINDVMSTTFLLEKCKKDLELRIDIEKEYNMACLSKDGVGIGAELLKRKYLEATGLKWDDIKDLRSPMDMIPLNDVILPKIDYNTPILKDMITRLRSMTVSPGRKGLEEQFVLDGVKISVGVGGIHSVNTPGIIKPADDELLLDCDAASLYPSLLIAYGFYPRHLGPEFVDIYSRIRTERLEAKHSGQKNKDTTLKLLLNSVTGLLQNEYSWLYSPFAVMQIRMNGQLLLLKLAEMLIQIGCRMIQYNTDGLFLICKKNKKDEYDRVIKEFEEFSLLTMETDEFEAMYQLAINDYFATKNGFSRQLRLVDNPDYTRIVVRPNKWYNTRAELYKDFIKEKGMFITEVKLGKGLTPKIIPKAVIDYFLYDTPVEQTIKECTDIRKFLMAEKTGKQWTVEYNEKEQQRTNRFYACNSGYYLWKWKLDTRGPDINKGYFCGYSTGVWTDEEFTARVAEYNKFGGIKQYQNMLAGYGVRIHNTFLKSEPSDKTFQEIYDVNYNYYISKAYKIIEELKPRQLELF